MRDFRKYSRQKEALDFFAVLWIILTTGSMYFNIFNMKMSMAVLLAIAGVYLLLNFRIKSRPVLAAACVFVIPVVHGLLNFRYFDPNDDILILFIRLVSLAVIFSNMDLVTFKRHFCHIVFGLCLLSLVCFGISEMGFRLPGEREFWFKDKYYIVTVYHTVGRWNKFHRNAGIFWESPAFAIIINTAIAFLMIGGQNLGIKRRNLYFAVYSVTVLTTLATTAYVAYAVLFAAIILDRHGRRLAELGAHLSPKSRKWAKIGLIVMMLVALIGFVYIESTMHIVERKLIRHVGSYNTRANDTLSDLKVAMRRPLLGFGMFNNYTGRAILELGVTDNSNWFVTTFMFYGFPLAFLYLAWFAYRLRKMFDCGFWSYLFLLVEYLVFINIENIGVMTLFLVYLIPISVPGRQDDWTGETERLCS